MPPEWWGRCLAVPLIAQGQKLTRGQSWSIPCNPWCLANAYMHIIIYQLEGGRHADLVNFGCYFPADSSDPVLLYQHAFTILLY